MMDRETKRAAVAGDSSPVDRALLQEIADLLHANLVFRQVCELTQGTSGQMSDLWKVLADQQPQRQ